MKKKWSVKKKIVVTLLSVIAAFLLVVIVYVLYVFGTYHRIKDKQPIEINSLNATEGSKVKTGVEYTAGTYNVGFGAYTPDYSFFMDGAKEGLASSQVQMPLMEQQIMPKVKILIL